MTLRLWIESLSLAAAVLGLALLMGVLAAIAIGGAGGWLRSGLGTLMLVAGAFPPFLGANHWLDLAASWRALASPSILEAGSWALAVLCLAALLWPLVTLLVLGAWTRLQPDLLEADPCIRGVSLLRGLLIPAARGELQVAAALVTTLALANFTVPVLFQIRVFTEEFWIRFNTQLDLAGALRSTWPLVVVPLCLLAILRARRVPWPRWRTDLAPGRVRQVLGGLWGTAAVVTVAWLTLTVVFPLARLAGTIRTWTELPGAALAGRSALFTSILTATSAATLIVGLAMLLRWIPIRIPGSRWLWLPFLLPGVFVGVIFIAMFNHPWTRALYQSLALPILALALRYAALGGSLVSQAHATADPALMDAARSLGAGPWRVFRDAVWPQVAPGAATAWYLVYLLCLWDVETVVLIQPPGGETLALRIFNLLHYGHGSQVNALCVLLLALALTPWILWTAGHAFFKGLRRRAESNATPDISTVNGRQ